MDTLPFVSELNYYTTLLASNAPNLVGFIMPPLVEYLNKDVVDRRGKFIVSVLACFMAAVLLKWNELFIGDVAGFLTSLTVIFTQSQTVYHLYFKNSALQQNILESLGKVEVELPERVEEKTTNVS